MMVANSSTPPPQTAPADPPSSRTVEAAGVPAGEAVPAVEPQAAALAAKHLTLALDTEGFAGAMIYSQSCFRSLELKFSWRKLDQCAAFDTLARLAISQTEEVGPEASYFGEAASSDRFTEWARKEAAELASANSHFAEVSQAAMATIPQLQQAAAADQEPAALGDAETDADESEALQDGDGTDVNEPDVNQE
jgi:hypothetical protein